MAYIKSCPSGNIQAFGEIIFKVGFEVLAVACVNLAVFW
jgi:hypothetical protein